MGNGITFLWVRIEIWALLISMIAIFFTSLKDFILPWIYKPRLSFNYEEEPPYRKENITVDNLPDLVGTFLRFSVKNLGRRTAVNCRCQILKVEHKGELYGDYQGFPLKWASRPEAILNPASGERLNIAIEETEFIDLVSTRNQDILIHLEKYHSVPIGIKDTIEPGKHDVFLLFSGDNFKPYTLKFHVNKEDSNDINAVKSELITFYQL